MIPPPPKKCSIYITNHPITSLWLVFHLSCWGFIVRPEKKKTGGLGGDKVITTVRIRWIITTQHRKNDRQSGASATWRMPIELFSNRWAGWHHSDGRFFCIASLSSYNYRTDVESDHWCLIDCIALIEPVHLRRHVQHQLMMPVMFCCSLLQQ